MSEGRPTPEYVWVNRAAWTGMAPGYAERAPRAWSKEEFDWGIWSIPESEVGALGDVDGLDVVELGCGTAYLSAWLARLGARPVGVDITPAQLATARQMQRRYGTRFPLIEASAEQVPLRDSSFDLALSEYGASIWCDPYLWIAEASRLLRPGGKLVFLRNTPILILCEPNTGAADDRLIRDYFGMHRFDWVFEERPETEFYLGYGDMVRCLRSNGFEILDLIELKAPDDAVARYEHVTAEWARRWPSEEIWVARKVS